MCGIFYLNGTRTDEYMIRASKLLETRGPDRGVIMFVPPGHNMVFRRLCINDISILGDQPMSDDKKTIFVMCNGEIFNYQQLIRDYDLECRSKSDCEVILRLYEKGVPFYDIVKLLSGDFAIVLVDIFKNMVYAARDRVGVRPLFYGFSKSSHKIALASEVKCLDFCYDINHVPPRAVLSFDLDKYSDVLSSENSESDSNSLTSLNPIISMDVYFDLEAVPCINQPKNVLKLLLIQAVRERLLSDRPIGCLLSGGLDSSIITSILCKLKEAQNIRTYSIGMKGSLDLFYAKKVAEHLNTNHTEILFTPEEGLKVIPEVINALETFDITTVRASVGMFLLGKYISENTTDKVIFSGEGSDELFCGYVYFHNCPNAFQASKESKRLISELFKYDCLRADRCISTHGLELRVPFLDRQVLNYSVGCHGALKMPMNGIEKQMLRELFEDDLPEDVVWRRKDGFSDGVSSLEKSWYEYISEFVETQVSDTEFAKARESSQINLPNKEAYYYKKIYDSLFPFYPNPIDHYWMPRWCDESSNPSGRVLKAFNKHVI